MLRPVSLLPALVVVVATLLGLPATPAQAAPEQGPARTPLAVTMDSLTPSVIPRSGPVRVTGSVTNRDDETWTDVNVYAFLSQAPMTTAAELADAAATGPDEPVGDRILTEGTYDSIGDLAPGQSRQYSLTVPRSELVSRITGDPGVYWFGTHALGFTSAGGDSFADGRARTFLPLVPKTTRTVDTALVIPVRRLVTHAPDGSLGDLDRWADDLSPGGTLRSLVDLGVAAGSRPVSWLVDPSVVDAARRLEAGNPPRSLAPTQAPDEAEQDGATGSASPSPTPTPDGTDDGADLTPNQQAAADAATSWLERLHEGLEGSEILTLPYGDVDVAASAAHDRRVYRQARRRSAGDLAPWGLPTTPAVSSPTGFLDADGIRMVENRATLLLTDRMFGERAPAVARVAGHTAGVTSSGAVSGGPGPDARMAPLAMRQRIVSEAAVRLLTPGRKPLIAVFPPTWTPESTPDFWEGLDLPWLNLTTVDSALQRQGTAVPADRLDYPENQLKLQLDAPSFAAADDLVQAGETLQNLLTQNDQVASEVHDEAWTDLSYSSRLRADGVRASAEQSRTWIETRLRSVSIDAPKAVILSSGSGKFAATITNTLDEPVSVRVRAVADPPLKVAVPAQTIELGADSRTTVLLNASSSAVGIRNVTLQLTDVDDVPLGSFDEVPIRSNRVSDVIWLIVGTGIALLFGAIVVRLYRRVRAARRT
ncbi:MAG TPA: DUF6049 family protein [Nocardioides sp.]|nr:DUF6049 family protein [Nocardioides sp.]